ncbi:hypothetical protein [Undibacterium sp. Ji22W]
MTSAKRVKTRTKRLQHLIVACQKGPRMGQSNN